VWYKTCVALWYNSAGEHPLHVVMVRDPPGRRKDDCFFSTDLSLSPKTILELFAQRRPLEVAFYNTKQFLGLEDPQNRTPKAVQRTAPLALYFHDLVILWFAKRGHFDLEVYCKTHPWYTQKRTPAFHAEDDGIARLEFQPLADFGRNRGLPLARHPRHQGSHAVVLLRIVLP
jgi:hypothetical protein